MSEKTKYEVTRDQLDRIRQSLRTMGEHALYLDKTLTSVGQKLESNDKMLIRAALLPQLKESQDQTAMGFMLCDESLIDEGFKGQDDILGLIRGI